MVSLIFCQLTRTSSAVFCIQTQEPSTLSEYVVITMDNCPYCDKAKALLTEQGKGFKTINIMDVPELSAVSVAAGHSTYPLVLKVVGGYTELLETLSGKKEESPT